MDSSIPETEDRERSLKYPMACEPEVTTTTTTNAFSTLLVSNEEAQEAARVKKNLR